MQVRNRLIYLGTAGAAFLAITGMAVTGVVIMTDFWTGLAVALAMIGLTCLYLAFKPKIDSWTRKTKDMESTVSSTKIVNSPSKQPSPDVKDGGTITTYQSQKELPPLKQVLGKAHETIEVLATTNEYMIFKESDFIKNAINKNKNKNKNIRVTILLPDPESGCALKKEQTLPDATNLRQRIQNSFDELCQQKAKFGDRLNIRKYDHDINKTIMVVDRQLEEPWIRVDDYILGVPTSSRRIREGSKKGNEEFYEPLLREYEEVLKVSEPYSC